MAAEQALPVLLALSFTLRQATVAAHGPDEVVLTGWDPETGQDVQITLRLSSDDQHQVAEDMAGIVGRELGA